MSAQIQTVAQLTQRATDALIKELGVVDTIRFLSQFRMGTGDYTVERQEMFKDMSAKDIIADIKRQRQQHG
ncbi:MAG: hypothetical protein ACWA44_05015 [Thiotrichales bacterium]